MKLLLPALVALVALSGCAAATHTVDPGLEGGNLAWANALFASKPTVVVLTDGTSYDATALRLEADTTTWLDPATQSLVAIPTSTVFEVERRDSKRASVRLASRGAIGGAAYGAVGGAVVGYETGGCFLSIVCGDPSPAKRIGGAAVLGISSALIGSVGGATIGIVTAWLSPNTERFEVVPSPQPGSAPSRAELDLEADDGP